MKQHRWTMFRQLQHQVIHWVYDILVWLHDRLIEYACERDLWRTPEQRAAEDSE